MSEGLADELLGDWWRYAVSSVGALLLGVGIGSVLVDGTLTSEELSQVGAVVVLSLLLIAAGARIAVDVSDAGDMVRVLFWMSVGVIALAALGGWYQIIFRSVDTPFDAALVFLSALAAGGLFGAVVGYYDVRVRSLAERAGREEARREFLREQQETLSALNGILRHQILNDLSAISGRAELLGSDRIGREEAVDSIVEHCDHMDAVVERIETLVEVLTYVTDTSEVSVPEAVDRAVSELRADHPDVDVAIATADATVLADELLYLALYELLDNAVVHGSDPAVSVRTEGEAVVIAVSDDGPGVEMDAGTLFEANTRGQDSDGDGLGLFVAGLIVDRYDGEIRLREDGGATFEVVLPAA